MESCSKPKSLGLLKPHPLDVQQQTNADIGLTQIPLARLCDSATALLLVLLQHTNLLQRLHDFAVDAAAGIDVVRRTTAPVASRAVDFSESSYTNGLAEVDCNETLSAIDPDFQHLGIPTMTRNRSSSNIEPIDRLRGELLRRTELDGINPTGDREFALER